MSKYQETLNGLKFTCEMFLFDPFNGETLRPEDLNEQNRLTYESNKFAYEYLNKYRWHDLRKNPNDLPPDSLDVLLAEGVFDGINYFVGYVRKNEEKGNIWHSEVFFLRNEDIIAWKYIEDFENE